MNQQKKIYQAEIDTLKAKVNKLELQSHGWHLMYKEAVVEIAELENLVNLNNWAVNKVKADAIKEMLLDDRWLSSPLIPSRIRQYADDLEKELKVS